MQSSDSNHRYCGEGFFTLRPPPAPNKRKENYAYIITVPFPLGGRALSDLSVSSDLCLHPRGITRLRARSIQNPTPFHISPGEIQKKLRHFKDPIRGPKTFDYSTFPHANFHRVVIPANRPKSSTFKTRQRFNRIIP
jgi:hypothetical protein